jgi:putative CocE/NonD family hydrolase
VKKASYLLLLLAVFLVVDSGWAQSPSEIVIQRNVEMKTRDGVTLRADIYHAAGDQKYPVLLQRTPYNKGNVSSFAQIAVAHGYLVVVQDTRGRYASDGEWYPFKYEINDGFDTVEWAAALPNSNGKVGMFGGSYVGATQMLAAISHPPHLAGICPWVTASNYHENWTYQGGAFEQWFNQSWTSGLAEDTFEREIRKGTDAVVGTALPLKNYPLFNFKLTADPTELTRQLAPYLLDWLNHPEYDAYWKQWSIEEQYGSIQVPALTSTAWYDIFQGGSLRNYAGMKAHAGNEAARSQQQLLIAIGGHAGSGRKIGSVDFGAAAAEFDENNMVLDWYDYLFQGKQNEFASGKPVRIFVMGENKWRSEDSWPLERAKQTRYLLHSAGKANSASGDGILSTVVNKLEPADSYVYDPQNPVPTTGGPLCCDSELSRPRPQGPAPHRNPQRRAYLFHAAARPGHGSHRSSIA